MPLSLWNPVSSPRLQSWDLKNETKPTRASGFSHFSLTIDPWPLAVALGWHFLDRRQILDFRLALGYIRGVTSHPFSSILLHSHSPLSEYLTCRGEAFFHSRLLREYPGIAGSPQHQNDRDLYSCESTEGSRDTKPVGWCCGRNVAKHTNQARVFVRDENSRIRKHSSQVHLPFTHP